MFLQTAGFKYGRFECTGMKLFGPSLSGSAPARVRTRGERGTETARWDGKAEAKPGPIFQITAGDGRIQRNLGSRRSCINTGM